VKQGVRLASASYQKLLKKTLLPWAENHFGEQRWTFQQDSAPCHTSFRDPATSTKAFLDANVPRYWWTDKWPAASPDLNPMDYSIWGILQARVGKKFYRSVKDLKTSLKREWRAIPQESIRKAIEQFPKRLELCIDARGGHIEHLM
jgi:inhibitor of nuclear factor kappa-B kinase subunit alpha